MDKLEQNMRFLCDETRMLTGITVAYGGVHTSAWAQYGRAQEVMLTGHGFAPCVRPIAPDTLYDLASLTKLFTCVMTMLLVRAGRLSLEERVAEIDPRFVHLSDVRVGDVLGFTVSLQTPGRIDDAPTREEGLARLFAVSVCPTPAVRVYSDINAMVIKYMIEAKTGMAFGDALKKYIFSPIGLTETTSVVPAAQAGRCMCYDYEHRIVRGQYQLRTDTPLGAPHDPKALRLSDGGRDLCGHAGLFSTRQDMVRLCSALLGGELLPRDMLRAIGTNRTGKPHGDGTYRQYLGYLCFSKHPLQRLSEVPAWMGHHAVGLSGFTGNHLSIDPDAGRFVLFLGNRCHNRVSHITPRDGQTLSDFGLDERGVGLIRWEDGTSIPSSAKYVYFKDEMLHAPIAGRLQSMGLLATSVNRSEGS